MNEFKLTPEQIESIKKFVKEMGLKTLDFALMYTTDHIKEVDFGKFSTMIHFFVEEGCRQLRKLLN